ncbi:MAG: serine hydrolase, partial [Chloroflexi bacterium]|nr:serine hydrolase [Chloroflexota bacterium]
MVTDFPEILGHCSPRFGPVKAAFERNFELHGEVGASVAVTLDGESVVDLWAGFADADKTRSWNEDTIVNVYSTTKGMVALCAHMLADRGLLDFETPVARYWPEFAQAGKEDMPVRYLMTHQAGLAVVDRDLPAGSTLEWDVMVDALAAQAPVWTPGEAQGYHAVTFGWLVGEVIRRIGGKSVGAFLRDNVTDPLNVDFLIGFEPEEDHRVADMLKPVQAASTWPSSNPVAGATDPNSIPFRAFFIAPPGHGAHVNSRQYRAAEVPAANGHGNARALARVY